jgi:hypothetical protein
MSEELNEAARALGRKGGASKSAAKQSASRANLAAARKYRHKPQPVTITINRPAPMAPEKLRAIVSAHLPKAGEPTEPVRLPIFDELDQREGGE